MIIERIDPKRTPLIRRRRPLLGRHPDYSKALYADPPSHDFLVFLVMAELMRRLSGRPGPLKVRFALIGGRLGLVDFGPRGILSGLADPCKIPPGYCAAMVANVLLPAVEMMGAVVIGPPLDERFEPTAIADYVEYDYHIGQLVDLMRAAPPFDIPRFKPPQWAFDEVDTFLAGKRPIIITLRETETQTERNSQIEEWRRFAEWAQRDGFPVLFLRDTAKADQLLEPFATWPRASTNAYVRAALYQRALVNMMVSNGPIGWCEFSDAPFLSFKQLVPDLPDWDHGNAKGWREQAHMEVGEQYPWCSPLQRLTWTDDTYDNLRDAFEDFLLVAKQAGKKTIPITRRLPPLGPRPDYSCAFYADPPSHDFCVWLVAAELMRRHHDAPAPLRVKFGLFDGQLGLYDFGADSIRSERSHRCGLTRKYSDEMLANVLRPAIAMMGAVEEPAAHAPFDLDALGHYVEYDYHGGHLIDAGRQGFEIPRFQPPQWAFDEVDAFLKGRRPVVITLREVPVQPERNSQIEEWMRFATSIRDCHPVLFVRDTCKAGESLPGFETWPMASINTYIRAALYQRAYVNMMVGNGPIVWAVHSDAPYLIFKQLVPALPRWDHGNAKGWRDQEHMEIGDQLPWATPKQRLTWTDDTYEEIASAFEAFEASLLASDGQLF